MIRPSRLAAVLPVLLALALPGAAEEAPASGVRVPFMEGKPFAEVLARAQREKKPVMLDVYASWCNPCKWMDRTTFTDPKVVSWVKTHAIPARLDAEKGEGRKIAGRFAVNSFPTVVYIDPSGNEIDRLMGAHPGDDFIRYGDEILEGKGPLGKALADIRTNWSMDAAMQLVTALGQRNDVARLRPIALRVVAEDPDLGDPRTLGALAVLVSLEDFAGKLTPEVADYAETYLPRLGADPRRGLFAVALAREYGRRSDWASLRKHVTTVAPTLPKDGYLADLYSALAEGERKAGSFDASVVAAQRALQIVQDLNAATAIVAARQFDVAEALLAAKKTAEGRAAIAKGLEMLPNDPGALSRAAALRVAAGDKAEAVRDAKRAVELTAGGDAIAQAALAKALAASGDQKGATAAWNKARQLEPDNPEYGKALGASSKKS